MLDRSEEKCPTTNAIRAPQSLRALDWLNFFLADVRTGVGPFLAVYLTSALHWNPRGSGSRWRP